LQENSDKRPDRFQTRHSSKIFAGVIALIVFLILRNFPELSDLLYRRFIFQTFRFFWDHTIGLLPFPLVYLFIIWLVWKIFSTLKKKETKKEFLLLSFVFLSRAFSLFMWMWGFNYACTNFKQNDFTAAISEMELYHFGEHIAETISLYDDVALKPSLNQNGYSSDITEAVENYLQTNGWLTYGEVKCVEIGGDGLLRRLGASGIYLPYTGQGHCDATYPDHVKLMIKAHETAHGYGITNEGEADYVAFMSLWKYDNRNEVDSMIIREFKYSAMLSLLRTIRTELNRMNDSLRIELDKKTSWNIRKEMMAIRINSLAYPSLFPELSTGLNDAYLKTMGVREGVKSYDEFLARVYQDFRDSSVLFEEVKPIVIIK